MEEEARSCFVTVPQLKISNRPYAHLMQRLAIFSSSRSLFSARSRKLFANSNCSRTRICRYHITDLTIEVEGGSKRIRRMSSCMLAAERATYPLGDNGRRGKSFGRRVRRRIGLEKFTGGHVTVGSLSEEAKTTYTKIH